MNTIELNETQEAELRRLKQYFPYRIVYAYLDKDNGDFHANAVHTMAKPNNLSRKGHTVFLLK